MFYGSQSKKQHILEKLFKKNNQEEKLKKFTRKKLFNWYKSNKILKKIEIVWFFTQIISFISSNSFYCRSYMLSLYDAGVVNDTTPGDPCSGQTIPQMSVRSSTPPVALND